MIPVVAAVVLSQNVAIRNAETAIDLHWPLHLKLGRTKIDRTNTYSPFRPITSTKILNS